MADDDRHPSGRSAEARRDDHAAIARLADDLLPALVAKLGASGLGELEVREGSWKVRIRMPERRAGRRGQGRMATDGGGTATAQAPASAPGQGAGSGAYAAAVSRGTGTSPFDPTGASGQAVGAAHVARIPVVVIDELDPDGEGSALQPAGPRRAIATSPAVGFFRPLAGISSGARIRAGDRVGVVDVLGVGHEVLAPVDGRVGATLVEAGEPVEYGQEVVEIELLPNGTSHGAGSATAGHTTSTEGAAAIGPAAGVGDATDATTDAAIADDGAAGGDGRPTPGAPASALTPGANG